LGAIVKASNVAWTPQPGWFQPASGSPGFAQLLIEHEQHLIAVFLPEGRRIAMQ